MGGTGGRGGKGCSQVVSSELGGCVTRSMNFLFPGEIFSEIRVSSAAISVRKLTINRPEVLSWANVLAARWGWRSKVEGRR